MFKSTIEAFNELESKLKCCVCNNVVVDAVTREGCDHFFCRKCSLKRIGESCNVCQSPYLSTEIRSCEIVGASVDHYLKMKRLMEDLSKCDSVVIQQTPTKVKEDKASMKRASPRQQPENSKRSLIDQQNCSVSKGDKASSKLNKRNGRGETQLHVASLKGKTDDVERHLRMGANPNTKDNAGWTPLHEACSQGFTVIAKMLLDHAANPNAVSSTLTTPLHDAVVNKRVDIVKLLLSYGADRYMQTAEGFTALDLADDIGIQEIREVLLSKNNLFLKKPSIPPVSSRFVITCTGLNDCHKIQFQKLESALNAKLTDTFSDDVTHLVASDNGHRTCSRTLKYLNAVLKGIWVVSTDWVDECLAKKKFVKEDNFEIKGTYQFPVCDGPRKGRESVLLKKPGLFNGCRFYFYGKFIHPSPKKTDLIQLVKAAEGIILDEMPDKFFNVLNGSPFHTKQNSQLSGITCFIVYCENATNGRKLQDYDSSKCIRALPQSWLLDCLTTFEIEDP